MRIVCITFVKLLKEHTGEVDEDGGYAPLCGH